MSVTAGKKDRATLNFFIVFSRDCLPRTFLFCQDTVILSIALHQEHTQKQIFELVDLT